MSRTRLLHTHDMMALMIPVSTIISVTKQQLFHHLSTANIAVTINLKQKVIIVMSTIEVKALLNMFQYIYYDML